MKYRVWKIDERAVQSNKKFRVRQAFCGNFELIREADRCAFTHWHHRIKMPLTVVMSSVGGITHQRIVVKLFAVRFNFMLCVPLRYMITHLVGPSHLCLGGWHRLLRTTWLFGYLCGCVCRGRLITRPCDGKLEIVFQGGIWLQRHCTREKVFSCRQGTGGVNSFGKIWYDFVCVGHHWYLSRAAYPEMHVHAQVVVYFSTVYDEAIAVDWGDVLAFYCDPKSIDMRNFKIFYVPSDCHLFAANCSVGNAWIIWVNNKRGGVIFEVVNKLPVK